MLANERMEPKHKKRIKKKIKNSFEVFYDMEL